VAPINERASHKEEPGTLMENKDKVQRTKHKAQERSLDESNAVPPKRRGITVAESRLGTKQLRKTER